MSSHAASPSPARRPARPIALLLPALLAGALALGLAGPAAAQQNPDPANPRVLVTNGKLSVDQEPLRFFKKQGKVKITWRLPAQGGYSFPADGIVIERADPASPDPREEFRCARGQNPRHFVCENRNSVPARYKYTVKAEQNGQPLEPLDPIIVNEL